VAYQGGKRGWPPGR